MFESTVYIPEVGAVLRLSKQATVTLVNEGQNARFIEAVRAMRGECGTSNYELSLDEGTQLTVDRVYVRKGLGAAFNSVTFVIQKCDKARVPKGRIFLSVGVVNSLSLVAVNAVDSNLNKNPVKRLHDNCYASLRSDVSCYSERAEMLWERFSGELKKQPILARGEVGVCVKANIENFQRAVGEAFSKISNVDKLEGAVEILLKTHAGRYAEQTVREHVNKLSAALKLFSEQEKVVPLFCFTVINFQGEDCLHIRAMPMSGSLDEVRQLMVDALSLHWVILRDLEQKTQYINPFNDVFSLFFSTNSRTPTFGQIRDQSPRVFVSPDGKEAILPSSGFSNNYLTITKQPSGKGSVHSLPLPLVFNMNFGEQTDITKLRAAIRKLSKD